MLLDDDDDDDVVVVVFGAGEGISTDELLLLVLLLLLLLLLITFSLGLTTSVVPKLNCLVTSSRVLITTLCASPLSKGFVSIISLLISVSDLISLLFVSTVAAALSFSFSNLICCSHASAEAIFNSSSLSFSSLMEASLLELLLLLLRLLSELRRRWECEFDELLDDDDCIYKIKVNFNVNYTHRLLMLLTLSRSRSLSLSRSLLCCFLSLLRELLLLLDEEEEELELVL